jgi:hypothetical protein
MRNPGWQSHPEKWIFQKNGLSRKMVFPENGFSRKMDFPEKWIFQKNGFTRKVDFPQKWIYQKYELDKLPILQSKNHLFSNQNDTKRYKEIEKISLQYILLMTK